MMLLQDIAEEVIRPLLPKGTKLSTNVINDNEKTVCLYNHKRQNPINTYSDTNKILNRHLSLTINWTDSYSETEKISNDIYTAISELTDKDYKTFHIKFVAMDTNMPIDDKRRGLEVYSKTIDFEIYYEQGGNA